MSSFFGAFEAVSVMKVMENLPLTSLVDFCLCGICSITSFYQFVFLCRTFITIDAMCKSEFLKVFQRIAYNIYSMDEITEHLPLTQSILYA